MQQEKRLEIIYIFIGIMMPIFTIIGCINYSNLITMNRNKENDREILQEEARAALIDFVEKEHYLDLKMSLPSLKKDKIEDSGNNWITIGKWNCNLKEKIFVVAVHAGPNFAEYSGVFKLLDGKWQAFIKREVHN